MLHVVFVCACFCVQFEYNNWMVSVAGLVAATVFETTWEQLVQDRIFGPLGMNSTYTDVDAAVATNNYAIPVQYDANGNVIPMVANINTLLKPIAPAGIIAYVISPMAAHHVWVVVCWLSSVVCRLLAVVGGASDCASHIFCCGCSSTTDDMSKWMRFLLAGGVTPSGERLVNLTTLATMLSPQVCFVSTP
jgi:CubicO group peptidase (beta-lactamase class C family)